MDDVERFLIYLAVGIALGALFSLIRYGRAAVRLLASIDRKLDAR